MAKQPVRIFHSELTDSYFAVTRYKELGNDRYQAITKYDVTADVKAIIKAALKPKKTKRQAF